MTDSPGPTVGLRGPDPRQTLDRARRLATPKTAKGLSRSNLIATCGFLVLSTLGTALAFNDKLLRPLAILGDLAVTEATLDNDYMQRVTTRGSIKTSSYQVMYTYVVDGKTYTGSSVTSEVPHVMMPVQYLKAQPGTSGMEMRWNAIIDLCIFGVPCAILLICMVVLALHMRRRLVGRPGTTEQRE